MLLETNIDQIIVYMVARGSSLDEHSSDKVTRSTSWEEYK